MTTLSWIFRLTDRVSGPARQITRELRGVRSEMASVGRGSSGRGVLGALGTLTRGAVGARGPVLDLHKGMTDVSRSGLSMGGVLGSAGGTLMAVAGAALAASAAILGVGAAGAESAIKLAQFQENSMVTLRTLLGSEGAARAEWGRAMEFARRTPFDTQDVIRMRTGLVGAGFTDSGERDVMSALLADIGALNPNDSTAMQRALLVFSQVRANDRAMGNDLMQLANLGINRRDVFREIAKRRGMQNADSAATARAIGNMVSHGQIQGNEFIRGVIDAMSTRTGGRGVGTLTGGMNGTLTGNISNLRSSIEDLLLGNEGGGTSLFQSAGMQTFNRVLSDTVALLASSSATGARLQKVLRNMIDTVFTTLFGAADRSSIEVVITKITDALESVTRWFVVGWRLGKAFFEGLRITLGPTIAKLEQFFGGFAKNGASLDDTAQKMTNFGKWAGFAISNVGTVVAAVVSLVAAVAGAFGWLYDFFEGGVQSLKDAWDQIPAFFRGIGDAIVRGLTFGLIDSWDSLLAVLSTLAQSLPGPVREALGIASPSRVFAELGEHTADGFALGLERGADRAQGAAAGMIDVGALGASSGGGRGLVIEQLVVNVGAGDDADETGQRIAEVLIEQLRRSFSGGETVEA